MNINLFEFVSDCCLNSSLLDPSFVFNFLIKLHVPKDSKTGV